MISSSSVGPKNEERLHRLGIWHFDQIAAWRAENAKWIGSYLAYTGAPRESCWVLRR
jgi:predicted flap endonuclease-1-like 5' DNA nuclease